MGNSALPPLQVFMRQFSLISQMQLESSGAPLTSLISYDRETFQELCTAGPNGMYVSQHIEC